MVNGKSNSKCGACGRFLSASAGVATCSTCPSIFHKGCVAIPDSVVVPKDWICPDCKKKQRKGDNSNTPVKVTYGIQTAPAACESATSSVSFRPESETAQSLPPTPPVVADFDIREMRRELAEYMAELRVYRKEMADLRVMVSATNDRVTSIERRIESIEQKPSTSGTVQIADLECTVTQLRQELADRDQEALLSDLEIGHLPEEKGENIIHAVTVLAMKLGVSLEERDIVFAERVGTTVSGLGRAEPRAELSGGARPRERRVVVRLARRNLRDELLRAARVRRTLVAADASGHVAAGDSALRTRIFINERLTRANRQLFHKVREECRKQQWRYSWTKQGRIYVRQNDGKDAHRIRGEADLSRFFGSGSV